MQNFPLERPFDNFRVAITDPSHFFGRSELLNTMLRSPFQVRILLAGRRLGKTSALRAVEWNLLNPNTGNPRRAFPCTDKLTVRTTQRFRQSALSPHC
jgi:hypothetical protein